MDRLPYRSAPPLPDELWTGWNTDPLLLAGLAAALIVAAGAGPGLLEDQQLGGLRMWVVAGLPYLGATVLLAFAHLRPPAADLAADRP
jgi:hypothetical protein